MLLSFPPLTGVLSPVSPLFDTIRRAFLSVVSKDEAVSRIILMSPGNKTFDVTVSDLGALVVTANDGKSRL